MLIEFGFGLGWSILVDRHWVCWGVEGGCVCFLDGGSLQYCDFGGFGWMKDFGQKICPFGVCVDWYHYYIGLLLFDFFRGSRGSRCDLSSSLLSFLFSFHLIQYIGFSAQQKYEFPDIQIPRT